MLARWNGALGPVVRQYGPPVWPGVPPEALVGFTSISSGATDDTTAAGFHEVGYWQTPAGLVSEGAAPTAGSTRNTYRGLATGAAAQQLLGRSADLTANAWKTALADQTVVGLLDLRGGYLSTANRLQSTQGWNPEGASAQTQWFIGCTAFSAGPGGAYKALEAFAPLVVGAYAAGFLGWLQGIVQHWRSGSHEGMSNPGHHGNWGYDALRTWQKWECGRALAAAVGGDTNWFALGLEAAAFAELEAQIVDVAYGVAP
jgi:hypothetical protein